MNRNDTPSTNLRNAIFEYKNIPSKTVEEICKDNGVNIENLLENIDESERRSPGGRKIADEIKEKAVHDYCCTDAPVSAICERYDISPTTLLSWIPPRKRRATKLTAKRKSEIRHAYQVEGLTVREIQQKFDIKSRNTVYSALKEQTEKQKTLQEKRESVFKDYTEGKLTVNEIALKYGINYRTVYYWIKALHPHSNASRSRKNSSDSESDYA